MNVTRRFISVAATLGLAASVSLPGFRSFAQSNEEATVLQAVDALTRITQADPTRIADLLEAAYFHDWHADPFSRGAYSYTPAHALAARAALAEPVRETLYFAGEATELSGHSATVHGAIATGKRAAQQILARRR